MQDYDPELDAADWCMEVQQRERRKVAGTSEGAADDSGGLEMQELARHSAARTC